jgi:hypothetical protein
VIIITGRNFGIIATDYKIIIIEERQMIIIQNHDDNIITNIVILGL